MVRHRHLMCSLLEEHSYFVKAESVWVGGEVFLSNQPKLRRLKKNLWRILSPSPLFSLEFENHWSQSIWATNNCDSRLFIPFRTVTAKPERINHWEDCVPSIGAKPDWHANISVEDLSFFEDRAWTAVFRLDWRVFEHFFSVEPF